MSDSKRERVAEVIATQLGGAYFEGFSDMKIGRVRDCLNRVADAAIKAYEEEREESESVSIIDQVAEALAKGREQNVSDDEHHLNDARTALKTIMKDAEQRISPYMTWVNDVPDARRKVIQAVLGLTPEEYEGLSK